MKVTILGCGLSWVIPSLISGFGDADSTEAKNTGSGLSIKILKNSALDVDF